MKFCAIICEYNPMHNGHIYQINEARKITSCDGILCVMGGNFNQRGLPCVFDKYTKAEIALSNGADAVCELPTAYCVQSAEIFALSSIKLLNSLRNVSHLCFGSECGDINLLSDIANYLVCPPTKFKKSVKKMLKYGFSYATSIENSLPNKQWLEVISKPNNLLAIEYLKAIKITKSKIKPVTIKRADNYNSQQQLNGFISSSAVRNAVKHGELQNIKNFIPNNIATKLENCFIDTDKLQFLSTYCFNIKNRYITQIHEVAEGIQNYLKKSNKPTSRYKLNRINRTKLNVLLDIDKKVIKSIYKTKTLPYIKVLSCKKEYLSSLKQCNTILIVRKNDIIRKSKYFKKLERIDNNGNILYNLISSCQLTEFSLYEKIKMPK